MKNSFNKFFSGIGNRLTHINKKQPLSFLSFFTIILLDCFVLFMIFQGLSDQTKNLVPSHKYFTYTCETVFLQNQWTENTMINNVATRIPQRYYIFDKSKKHPLCQNFQNRLNNLFNDKELLTLFENRKKLLNKESVLKNRIEEYKYNFELNKMETQNAYTKQRLASIRLDIDDLSLKLRALKRKIRKIDVIINSKPIFMNLKTFIISKQNSIERNKLKKDLTAYRFWYSVKTLGFEFIFLLPLFIVFYFWNVRSIKNQNGLQALISSHLLGVALIPIVVKFFEFTTSVLPKRFFTKIWRFLESINLVGIWHYLVIIFAIGFAIFLIYLLQKTVFNSDRLYRKRLINQQCLSCGIKLPINTKVCPFCSANQFQKCKECHQDSIILGDFCSNCGHTK